MDLTQLTGAPELTVTLGGRHYHFSELPLESLGRLQAYIRRTVPDPFEHARAKCKGLPESVQATLLENARRESLRWPPQLGTAEGAHALLDHEAGQVEAIHEGLQVHHAGASREEAVRVYRLIRGEAMARRVFGVLFGLPSEAQQGESIDPKS